MPERQEITIVNPSPRKRRKRSKKKMAKRRRRRTTTARRRPARRRRRRRNPRRPPSVPVARNPRRRGRRRSNPTRLGGLIKIRLGDDLRYGLFRLAGKMASAWAVRRFGGPEGEQPSGLASPTTGARWNFKQLLIAWVSGALAGNLTAHLTRKTEWGQQVYDGSVDLVLTKMWWSEIVHRIGGAGGAAMFGQAPEDETGQMAVLAQQATENDVLDDGSGNRWLMQGGRWVAMTGDLEDALYGQDVELAGQLEEATPLDGVLETATPLDGYQQRQLQEEAGMGHLMDPGSPSAAADEGAYLRRGSTDPYLAAYM